MFRTRIYLFALALLLAGGGDAFAHASLLSSDPADGGLLARAPTQVILTFNEPVAPTVFRLVEPGGITSDLSDVKGDGATVTAALPALNNGTHALSWRVISADGHPVSGTIIFSVGAASASHVSVETATPPVLRALIWGSRLLLYGGLFFGVGGTFFNSCITQGERSRAAGRFIDVTLALGLAASILSLGLQGADMLGGDTLVLASWRSWHTAMDSTFALTVAIAASSMLLALLAGRMRPVRSSQIFSLLAMAGCGLALAASGHASDAQPQIITRPAVFIHAICIAFWVGSLVPLASLLQRESEEAVAALGRFSAWIPLALALLVAAGLTLATIQVEHPEALWSTAYGRILLGKLTLVVVLFALGAWNRWRLTGRVSAQAEQGRVLMRRLIFIEGLIALAILGLVASWRFTPPPRALAVAAAAAAPAHVHIHRPEAMADVSVNPGHVGPVSVSLSILDGEAGLLNAKEVSIVLSNPALGIEPIRAAARQIEGAAWRVDGLTVPAPGQWRVAVKIFIDQFTELSLEGTIEIRR